MFPLRVGARVARFGMSVRLKPSSPICVTERRVNVKLARVRHWALCAAQWRAWSVDPREDARLSRQLTCQIM